MKSILSPEADIVKDYPNIMPSFEGELSEEEIASIIQYIKTIK
jgi:cytochrome c oxidase subunit 2